MDCAPDAQAGNLSPHWLFEHPLERPHKGALEQRVFSYVAPKIWFWDALHARWYCPNPYGRSCSVMTPAQGQAAGWRYLGPVDVTLYDWYPEHFARFEKYLSCGSTLR